MRKHHKGNTVEQNTLSRKLRMALAWRGKNGSDLARHLGISVQAVHKFTSGKMYPTSGRLMEVCRFLDVSTEYLLGGDDVDGQVEDILGNVLPRKTARQLYLGQLRAVVDVGFGE